MEKGVNASKKMKSDAKTSGANTGTTSTPLANNSMPNKTTPKDVLIVTQILKDMGITDYEPRVVHQMIEFTYRYVSNVLEDAHFYSSYAKKKSIDSDDISLAIQLQVDKSFTGPPPRDLLLDIARTKNGQTLPPIKSHNGPRLPPDRYSLIACNYKQKSNKSKVQSTQQNSFRSSVTGTSLNNSSNSSSILKPMTTSLRTDSQSLKRKLDE